MTTTPYKKLLAIPIGLYLVLSLIYIFAIPIGESPDEPGHLQCIEQVSQYNRIPIVEPKPVWGESWSRSVIISGRMCYHMPLYYLIGGTIQHVTAFVTQTPQQFEFPPTNPEFIKSRVMFFHDDKASFWDLPETPAVISTRLLSICLGAMTIWGSYYIARRVFPDKPILPILAATLVAGLPQFVYLSRSINNDALATALAVGILMILITVGHPKRFVAAALLSSLAVLTKLTISFVVIAVIITWIAEFFIFHTQRKQYIKVLLISLSIWVGVALLIMLQPTLREHISRGSGEFSAIWDEALTLVYWRNVLTMTASSGWVRFGWMNVPAPQWQANGWWLGILVTGLIGLIATWYRQKTEHLRLILFILGIWMAGILAVFIKINLNRFQPQFRFMLASLPVFMTFSSAGIIVLIEKTKWFDKHMIGIMAVAFSALFLLGYNCWILSTIVRSIYG